LSFGKVQKPDQIWPRNKLCESFGELDRRVGKKATGT